MKQGFIKLGVIILWAIVFNIPKMLEHYGILLGGVPFALIIALPAYLFYKVFMEKKELNTEEKEKKAEENKVFVKRTIWITLALVIAYFAWAFSPIVFDNDKLAEYSDTNSNDDWLNSITEEDIQPVSVNVNDKGELKFRSVNTGDKEQKIDSNGFSFTPDKVQPEYTRLESQNMYIPLLSFIVIFAAFLAVFLGIIKIRRRFKRKISLSFLKDMFFVSYLKNKGIRRLCLVVGIAISAYILYDYYDWFDTPSGFRYRYDFMFRSHFGYATSIIGGFYIPYLIMCLLKWVYKGFEESK